MNKNVLVTGATGYIGSVLTEELLKKNHTVIAIDNEYIPIPKNLINEWQKKYSNQFTFLFDVDIRNIEKLERVFKENQIDTVMHLAGVRAFSSNKENKDTMDINFQGTKNIANLSKKYNVSQIIFASTCSNYGVSEKNEIFTENSPTFPLTLYAKSKINAENFLKTIEGPQKIILRCATAFGKSKNMRYDLMINEFAQKSYKKEFIEIWNPNVWRPFCHVSDIAKAYILMLENDIKEDYIIFNVGDSKENYTKQQILNMVLSKTKNSNVVIIKTENDIDKRDYRVDFSKIKKYTNFEASVSVFEGIDELIEFEKRGG